MVLLTLKSSESNSETRKGKAMLSTTTPNGIKELMSPPSSGTCSPFIDDPDARSWTSESSWEMGIVTPPLREALSEHRASLNVMGGYITDSHGTLGVPRLHASDVHVSQDADKPGLLGTTDKPWECFVNKSVGSVGHPHCCANPCKYWRRKGGCRDGSNCPKCHLCQWSRCAVKKTPTIAPPETNLVDIPHISQNPLDCILATDLPSIGSIGHPFACADACKYHGKKAGCKEGSLCTRCHLCSWKRCAERKSHKRAPLVMVDDRMDNPIRVQTPRVECKGVQSDVPQGDPTPTAKPFSYPPLSVCKQVEKSASVPFGPSHLEPCRIELPTDLYSSDPWYIFPLS